MCDFSGKLIVWMDGELPESEAAPVEEHLEGCAECRSRLSGYRQASSAFVAYCEAATTAEAVLRPQRALPRWAVAAGGAAAAAALFLVLIPRRVMQSPAERHLAAHASAGLSMAPAAIAATRARSAALGVHSFAAPVAERAPRNPASAHTAHREHVPAANTVERPAERVPARSAASLPSEPAIEIAIPSDAIFPAGAVPDGVSFVAEVTLAADGTAEWLRLQPRLAQFERRATRP